MERQFNSSDVVKILRNKLVIIIGDSIHRSIYKDLVLLIQKDRFLTRDELKAKGELTFLDDELVEGGKKDGLSNGIGYREARRFKTENHHVRFYFVTRCYNAYVKNLLLDFQEEPQPDILIMNSCLWDISRYGTDCMKGYKKNMLSLFSDMNNNLPKDCLLIWDTTLPVSKYARGGFMAPDQVFQHAVLSANILDANMYVKYTAHFHDIEVLDLYSHLWNHCELQVQDGVHWDMVAHRFISNLIMELICNRFGSVVPYRRSALSSNNSCQPDQLYQGHHENILTPVFQQPSGYSTPVHCLPGQSRRPIDSFQSPNLSHSSVSDLSQADFYSPVPDHHESDFYHNVPSPNFSQTSYTDFKSSNSFSTPVQRMESNSFQSPSGYYQSPSFYHSPHSPALLQSPQFLQNLNIYQDLCHMFCQTTNLLLNGQNRSRYAQSSAPPLMNTPGNGFFNLGQYNQQHEQFGAMRVSARKRRKPYSGSRKN